MCATSSILARGADIAEVGSWDLWVREVRGTACVGGEMGWGSVQAATSGGSACVRGGATASSRRAAATGARRGVGLSGSSSRSVRLVRRVFAAARAAVRPGLCRGGRCRSVPIFTAAGRDASAAATAAWPRARGHSVVEVSGCGSWSAAFTRAWPRGHGDGFSYDRRRDGTGPADFASADRLHPPPPHAPPRRGPRRFRQPLALSRRRLPPPPVRAGRRDRDLRRGDRDSDCQWGVAGSGAWQRQHRRRPTRPPGTPPAETVHG